jgi:mono/diheme cytochrome c family protein
MKTILIGTLSLSLSLTVASAGVPEGKVVFTSKCQACHGPTGEGKASIAKLFNVTMHPFGSSEIQSKPDAEIKKTITAGHGKMKPVTGLTDQQVDDVVAFVRTLKE